MSKCPVCEKETCNCIIMDVDEAPLEVQKQVFASMRDAIRRGAIEFGPQVRAKMKEDGITEEELLSMMMQKAGLDS